MKTVLIFICIAAIFRPNNTAAMDYPSYGATLDNKASKVALEIPAPAAQHAHGKQTASRAPGNLSGFRGTVVKEMRATKTFVKENVVKEERADRGLMLLAAIGMIILQLRRKHKSLPQRQISPYA
jgi:hypothetical protein